MKALAVSAFAIALAGGLFPEAQAQDQRHFESGVFTLNVGETADLTGDHIPLEFVQVWPHPFGNRAINITVSGKSYTVGVGARIDLKSRFLWRSSDEAESTLGGKDHCSLEITHFDNPEDGTPKVTFALDCK
jgi:hypothetical protein